MKRGGWNALDYPGEVQYFTVAIVGNGAAAPLVPTDGLVKPNFPKKGNAVSTLAAEAPARSGAGAYTVQYGADFQVFFVMEAPCDIFGTTGMWAQVTAVNEATRTLTIKVFNAAGAATDLAAATDLLVITLRCVDSNTIKT